MYKLKTSRLEWLNLVIVGSDSNSYSRYIHKTQLECCHPVQVKTPFDLLLALCFSESAIRILIYHYYCNLISSSMRSYYAASNSLLFENCHLHDVITGVAGNFRQSLV